MRIPQKLSMLFILGASALLFMVMLLFVAQQFTGYPEIRQDLDKDMAQVNSRISLLNSEILNSVKVIPVDER